MLPECDKHTTICHGHQGREPLQPQRRIISTGTFLAEGAGGRVSTDTPLAMLGSIRSALRLLLALALRESIYTAALPTFPDVQAVLSEGRRDT